MQAREVIWNICAVAKQNICFSQIEISKIKI